MAENNEFSKLITTIETAMQKKKCRKCGCMKGSLEEIEKELAKTQGNQAELLRLRGAVKQGLSLLEATEYS